MLSCPIGSLRDFGIDARGVPVFLAVANYGQPIDGVGYVRRGLPGIFRR